MDRPSEGERAVLELVALDELGVAEAAAAVGVRAVSRVARPSDSRAMLPPTSTLPFGSAGAARFDPAAPEAAAGNTARPDLTATQTKLFGAPDALVATRYWLTSRGALALRSVVRMCSRDGHSRYTVSTETPGVEGVGESVQRSIPVLVALLVFLCSVSPVVSAGSPEVLFDRSFGQDGRVVVRLGHRDAKGLPIKVTVKSGGDLYVSTGRHLLKYLADGRPDPDFGNRGRIEFLSADPGLELEPRVLLWDARGGVVVGGTSRGRAGLGTAGEALPTIRRYSAAGLPVPQFAQGGTFMSDFGFPALGPFRPRDPGREGYPPSLLEPDEYGHPHVLLSGLSSDRQGRLTLKGSALLTKSTCTTGVDPMTSESYAARLMPDGSTDLSFGTGGVRVGQLQESPCGQYPIGETPRVPSYNFIGDPHHARSIASASGVDARGRTTVLIHIQVRDGLEVGGHWYLVRLTRSDRFDPGFGDDGVMGFAVPGGRSFASISDIRVNGDGSVLLIGTTRPLHRPRGHAATRLLLGRVNPRGRIERDFGRDGFSSLGFGRGVEFGEPLGFSDTGGGRVVLWASIGELDEEGFVLARTALTSPEEGRSRSISGSP